MLSPGGGEGNKAAALAQGKAIMPVLHRVLGALPVGSKEYQMVLRMLTDGAKVFGEPQEGNLIPAAVQQMGKAAAGGNSPLAAVAPGLKPAPIPPPSPASAPMMAA